jgi:RHS repeat-associated protein
VGTDCKSAQSFLNIRSVGGIEFNFLYGGVSSTTLSMNGTPIILNNQTPQVFNTVQGVLSQANTFNYQPVNKFGGNASKPLQSSMCYFNYNFEDYIDNNSSTTSTDVTTVFTFNNSSSNTVQGTITKGNNNFGNFNGANIYNAFTLISSGTNVTTTPQNVNLVQTQGTLSTMYATGACPKDTDGDGLFDQYEAFDNGNGTYSPIDTDGDGLPNHLDIDDDGDGILSMYERNDDDENHNPNDALNTDGDGYPNYLDVDDDNDGYVTWETLEGGPGIFNAEIPTISNGLAYTLDTDTDTIPNYLDNTNGNLQVTGPISVNNFISLIGDKRYELSNHLGNVLVVINDKKIPNLNGTSLINFNADVLSYNDYYPFGQLVPNRHGSSDAYRYGFNGMEKDDELKGEGNSYDFGARMLDPRIGRWFAVDKKYQMCHGWSPYNYVLNSPIYFVDPDGNSPFDWYKDKFGNYIYDKNIKSQKDLGKRGKYLGPKVMVETFSGSKHNSETWINSYDLNADGSVVGSFAGQVYQDNFGKITITKGGIKIINNFTLEENIDKNVIQKLENASDYLRSIEGTRKFKSSNLGVQVGIGNDFTDANFEIGVFSTGEHSAGLYKVHETSAGLNLFNTEKSLFSYIPIPYIKIKANLNDFNAFESGVETQNVISTNATINIPDTPVNFSSSTDTNIETKKTESSFGLEVGSGIKTSASAKAVRKSTNTSVTKEIKTN